MSWLTRAPDYGAASMGLSPTDPTHMGDSTLAPGDPANQQPCQRTGDARGHKAKAKPCRQIDGRGTGS